ncbi:MAG: magnesium/cobalt transporter CorA [Coriobacteriales bacterium]|nr:magnesium/cobalt transporter CorA [Actinomycetes bacterium]
MSSRITVRWVKDGQLKSDGLESLPAELTGPVWVDITDPDEETFGRVSERFPLPPLAVEDCLHFPQRPKYDVYPDLTFLIWLAPYAIDGVRLETHELDVFLGEEHLVTAHQDGFEPLDRVAESANEFLRRGAEWTLHAILDESVDDIFPVVEHIADELEDLEDLMLQGARQEHLQRLFAAKRSLIQLHKAVAPERDIVRGLARLEAFVEPDAYMYFQDVGDHLARVQDSIETYRDMANGSMDIYLSSQSNRMNLIMKQLTIIATIFMPLTLLSGIYGMNLLRGMWPPAEAAWSFPVVIGSMVFIGGAMLWYFRRRDWW